MAKVKFLLYEGESLRDAECDLHKAISHHISGDVHNGEQFADPMIRDAVSIIEKQHEKTYKLMLDEIIAVIEEDAKNGDI